MSNTHRHTGTDTVLSARGLSRWEGSHRIAHRIDLTLQKGEVLGLLGLNGAGKTTTLNMLAGVLAPSAGEVRIAGHAIHGNPREQRAAKRHLGYLPEQPPLYNDMRVEAYLTYCGRLHGLRGRELKQAVQLALADCDLEDARKRLIRNLSKGYRQRIGIAQAIIHRPEVILLDEPSSGLDPQQMIAMRSLVNRLGEHHGIIFSTHLLSEATAVCNRICVIHQGEVVHQQSLPGYGDAPEPLDRGVAQVSVRLAGDVRAHDLLNLPSVLAVDADVDGDDLWHLDVALNRQSELLPEMIKAGWQVQEFGPRKLALETLFTNLVSGSDEQGTDEQASLDTARAKDTATDATPSPATPARPAREDVATVALENTEQGQ